MSLFARTRKQTLTAAALLARLLTVDGAGSGLDADLLDGQSGAYYATAAEVTPASLLTKLLTVDGTGSGLDADLLDGQSSAYYRDAGNIDAGILAAARGGTGVSNAGTLTNASNTTITGGGTLALGGFDLTVPATGTAALINLSQTFSARQIIAPGADTLALYVTGTATGGNWSGRIIAGGPTSVFLLGQYNDQAWLGAHNAALNAWANIHVNPDGGAVLYLGKYGYTAGSASMLTLSNASGNVLMRGALAGALGIATDSETNPLGISGWDPNKHVLLAGPGTGATASAVCISYNQGAESGALVCLTPLSAWRAMTYNALSHSFFNGNSAVLALQIGSSSELILNTASLGSDIKAIDSATTWNNGAVAFTGWKLNVAGTAYAAASRLLDLQLGGSSRLAVDPNPGAGQTSLLIYDADNATLERVTVGAADSGGAGFKALRIPN